MSLSGREIPSSFDSTPNVGPWRTLLFVSVSLPAVAILIYGSITAHDQLADSALTLTVWWAALAFLNLMPALQASGGQTLSADIPLIVAASLLFAPFTAGLIGFLGTCDVRELRGRVSLRSAVFNRSQVALSMVLASALTHAIYASSLYRDAFHLVSLTLVGLAVVSIFNHLCVILMAAAVTRAPIATTLGDLKLGRVDDYAWAWIAWGFLAALLVAAYASLGVWAVPLFCVPTLIGRQILVRSQSDMRAEMLVVEKRMAFVELGERIEEERQDERHRIASNLHDEVLQPLYQVSLLCNVVTQDLAQGKLLDLDQDIPALRVACQQASGVVRDVVSSLRASPIGVRGLASTVQNVARDLQTQVKAQILVAIDDLGRIPDGTQLVVYEVAKEALLNAAHHSRAGSISLRLMRDADQIRLTVEDDGIGFEQRAAHYGHFGLLIMRERAESVGGTLYVDSAPGEGTIVAARFPCS
ncbi:MAG TPA: ATP-binding protein [Actinomycetota bacterium]|jgi:signal transduction histidine kinase